MTTDLSVVGRSHFASELPRLQWSWRQGWKKRWSALQTRIAWRTVHRTD